MVFEDEKNLPFAAALIGEAADLGDIAAVSPFSTLEAELTETFSSSSSSSAEFLLPFELGGDEEAAFLGGGDGRDCPCSCEERFKAAAGLAKLANMDGWKGKAPCGKLANGFKGGTAVSALFLLPAASLFPLWSAADLGDLLRSLLFSEEAAAAAAAAAAAIAEKRSRSRCADEMSMAWEAKLSSFRRCEEGGEVVNRGVCSNIEAAFYWEPEVVAIRSCDNMDENKLQLLLTENNNSS